MTKSLATISLVLLSALATAQVTINAPIATDGATMAFSVGGADIVTSNELVVSHLIVDGGATLSGDFRVNNTLDLYNGLVTIPAGSRLLYTGSNEHIGADESAYLVGMFTQQGTGTRIYPIGTADVYAPIELTINGSDATTTGMQAIYSTSGFGISKPSGVDTLSQRWSWHLEANEGFSAAQVTLPILPEDQGMFNTSQNIFPVVLESDGVSAFNLGALSMTLEGYDAVEGTESSINPGGTFNRVYLLGGELNFTPVIHNIITPNNDNINDYLIIDAINNYADNNEVIILDRWGTEIYRKKNFINFNTTDNLYDGSFDFLEPGNYICILKYGDSTLKQVITVLN